MHDPGHLGQTNARCSEFCCSLLYLFKKQTLAGYESALGKVTNCGWQKDAFDRPLPGGFRVAKMTLQPAGLTALTALAACATRRLTGWAQRVSRLIAVNSV